MRKILFIAIERHNFFIGYAKEVEKENKGIVCATIDPSKHPIGEAMDIYKPALILIDGLIAPAKRLEIINEVRRVNPSVSVLIYKTEGQDYSVDEMPMLISGKQQIVASYAVH